MLDLVDLIHKKDLKALEKSLKKKSSVDLVNTKDDYQRTLLHFAVEEGSFECVKLLIDKGASLNSSDKTGWSPLHVASIGGHFEIINLLLDKGASPKVVNHESTGILSYLVRNEWNLMLQQVIETYQRCGGEIDMCNKFRETALHQAASKGKIEATIFLIKHGANVNFRNNFGETPLHKAVRSNSIRVVEILLAHGASASIEGDQGPPRDLAISFSHQEIVDLFNMHERSYNKPAFIIKSPSTTQMSFTHDGRVAFDVNKSLQLIEAKTTELKAKKSGSFIFGEKTEEKENKVEKTEEKEVPIPKIIESIEVTKESIKTPEDTLKTETITKNTDPPKTEKPQFTWEFPSSEVVNKRRSTFYESATTENVTNSNSSPTNLSLSQPLSRGRSNSVTIGGRSSVKLPVPLIQLSNIDDTQNIQKTEDSSPVKIMSGKLVPSASSPDVPLVSRLEVEIPLAKSRSHNRSSSDNPPTTPTFTASITSLSSEGTTPTLSSKVINGIRISAALTNTPQSNKVAPSPRTTQPLSPFFQSIHPILSETLDDFDLDTGKVTSLVLEYPPSLYSLYFYKNEHFNLAGHIMHGKDHSLSDPIILSLMKFPLDGVYRGIVWTKQGSYTMHIPSPSQIPSSKRLISSISKNIHHQISRIILHNMPELEKPRVVLLEEPKEAEIEETRQALFELELSNPQTPNRYSIGIVYSKDGQATEEEIISNLSGSEAYEEFLEFLGDKIELQGWSGYRADLDVKSNTTGSHSLYTLWIPSSTAHTHPPPIISNPTQHNQHSYTSSSFNKEFPNKTELTNQNFVPSSSKLCFEIMFHVTTMLPFENGAEEQISRKRRIGNNISVIIFQDGGTYVPPIRSKFLHIYYVISPIQIKGRTHYKLTVLSKKGVPSFGPVFHHSEIFEKGDYFREFLLTKLINGQLAALRSPELAGKVFVKPREAFLNELINRAKSDKTVLSFNVE